MLFFTKICIAVQSIDRDRSIARCTPPPMDIWAPRSGIADFRLPIADWGQTVRRRFRAGRFINLQSAIDNLKSLRVPLWLGDTAFAFVFEKFVHRGEEDAGAAAFDANIEVEFVLEEMDVAVADHAEELAGNLEVVGVNDAVLNGKSGPGLAGETVTGAGNNG